MRSRTNMRIPMVGVPRFARSAAAVVASAPALPSLSVVLPETSSPEAAMTRGPKTGSNRAPLRRHLRTETSSYRNTVHGA